MEKLQESINLFNQQKYFEAHELLEEIWNQSPSEKKKFIQAFVQLSAAMHLISQGRYLGAKKVLDRARANLLGYDQDLLNIDLMNLHFKVSQALDSENFVHKEFNIQI